MTLITLGRHDAARNRISMGLTKAMMGEYPITQRFGFW
jgi:hypothetical protein